MYGLKEELLKNIIQIAKQNPNIEELILIGSRAKGSYRTGSDIDLVLKGERLTINELLDISAKLEDKCFPYKFDLHIYHKIKSISLIDDINKTGRVLYKKI